VNWEGIVYNLFKLALNAIMVLLLVSMIRQDGVSCQLGQIMNQVVDGDGSCVKATEEGEFLT
jgi:hypothetical protein